jgi:2-iminobutanoate/2-iminopropanoate deaminase
MTVSRITAPDAAPPSGAYSHAVVHGDTVYSSGALPLDPATGALVAGGVGEQTRRTIANLDAVLRAAGSSLDRVLRATVYLVSRDDWAEMDAAFGEAFAHARPARTAIEVGPLAYGARVEIDVVAARE